jgi:hypothetical protein
MAEGVPALDPTRINDAQYWRDRAIETRNRANGLTNMLAREEMAYIASRYDRVADKLEERNRK